MSSIIYESQLKTPFFTFIIASILIGFNNPYNATLSVLLYVVFLICILLLFAVSYRVELQHDVFIYRICLFEFTLFKRILKPSDILVISFKRKGWQSKTAIIKSKKGARIRLVVFQPNHFYEDLQAFCDDYAISYTRTKDYILLEKMEANHKRAVQHKKSLE